MKKRILVFLLCVCIATTGFVYSVADGTVTGDANGDGKITAADASFILRYLSRMDNRMTTRNKMCADINCDGIIEVDEAAAILRHVTGLHPITQVETDTELLDNLCRNSLLNDSYMTEWGARFIQSLPTTDPHRSILIEGTKYISEPYSQYTCDQFVSAAYNDAGIPKTVYPQKSSDRTLNWFKEKDRKISDPELQYLQEVVIIGYEDNTNKPIFDTSSWKPGSVLIYVNPSTNKANHLAIFVGCIDGVNIIMDSGTTDGVRLIELWEYGNWKLTYCVDPLK